MKRGHSFWAKTRHRDEIIDLQGLFNNYWSSNEREFLVSSKSNMTSQFPRLSSRNTGNGVVGKHRCSLELHFSVNNTVGFFATTVTFNY